MGNGCGLNLDMWTPKAKEHVVHAFNSTILNGDSACNLVLDKVKSYWPIKHVKNNELD